MESLSKHILTEVSIDVSEKQTSIPLISDMPSIVNSSNQVTQSLPWGILILIQICGQNIL